MSEYTAWRVYMRFTRPNYSWVPLWKSIGDQLALFTTKRAAQEAIRCRGLGNKYVKYTVRKVRVKVEEMS